MNKNMLKAILDAIPFPIVFADVAHVIRFLNAKADEHYQKSMGYKDLVGKSLLDCHGEGSRQKMKDILAGFQAGGGELFLKINSRKEKVYVVPVRDEKGALLGYFERFEPQT